MLELQVKVFHSCPLTTPGVELTTAGESLATRGEHLATGGDDTLSGLGPHDPNRDPKPL